jgi:hypothetical protein
MRGQHLIPIYRSRFEFLPAPTVYWSEPLNVCQHPKKAVTRRVDLSFRVKLHS